jgi:hypothetical protein
MMPFFICVVICPKTVDSDTVEPQKNTKLDRNIKTRFEKKSIVCYTYYRVSKAL